MQKNTIQKIIAAKMLAWTGTIASESLRNRVRKNLLVSGGCITSMFLNEDVNDYDVYIKDMSVLYDLAKYYTEDTSGVEVWDGRKKEENKDLYVPGNEDPDDKGAARNGGARAVSYRNLKEDQIKLYFDGGKGAMKLLENQPKNDDDYTPMFLSPNSISLTNNIQIVLRFNGNAAKIHSTYDFIHATNYYTQESGLVLNLEAVTCILTKQLRYQGSLYPVTSIIRAKKFIKRGWNVSAGELMKIMFAISKLDLSDIDTLEEQLIGVDIAYFDKLIEALRNKQETPNFKVSQQYLTTLIDRIFNGEEE